MRKDVWAGQDAVGTVPDGAALAEVPDGAAVVEVPDGAPVVEVPRNLRALVPVTPERVRRLRHHLVASLRAERELKRPERFARPALPDPEGLAGDVARAACTLCGGWCCKGGEEHAYLDERTMARVRRARPELEARQAIRLYVERVPAEGYEGSCVFHGATGCTLDRSLRSDVCNSYFCSGLGNFVKAPSDAAAVLVVAGTGVPNATDRVRSVTVVASEHRPADQPSSG